MPLYQTWSGLLCRGEDADKSLGQGLQLAQPLNGQRLTAATSCELGFADGRSMPSKISP